MHVHSGARPPRIYRTRRLQNEHFAANQLARSPKTHAFTQAYRSLPTEKCKLKSPNYHDSRESCRHTVLTSTSTKTENMTKSPSDAACTSVVWGLDVFGPPSQGFSRSIPWTPWLLPGDVSAMQADSHKENKSSKWIMFLPSLTVEKLKPWVDESLRSSKHARSFFSHVSKSRTPWSFVWLDAWRWLDWVANFSKVSTLRLRCQTGGQRNLDAFKFGQAKIMRTHFLSNCALQNSQVLSLWIVNPNIQPPKLFMCKCARFIPSNVCVD